MTIFGESRLGRLGYAFALILMLILDFGKGPIERYIMTMHDEAASELLKPRVVKSTDQPEAGTINGKAMPFMLKGQEDVIRSIVNSKENLSKAEIRARLQAATQQSMLIFEPNYPVDAEIKRLATTRSNLAMLHPFAVVVMTAITVIGLLWMVSSRLRDIGWPQVILWVLLAPVFLPKFVHVPLPALAVQGISLFFYVGILLLALIPGESSRTTPQPERAQPRPIEAKRKSGQFGRLGG